MSLPVSTPPLVAIACGGTGGHVFPGLAIAHVLQERGVDTLVLVSAKEVDQQAVATLPPKMVLTLPAVALERGRLAAFVAGFWRSFRAARRSFRSRRPAAVLSMGGFTSVGPALAGSARNTPLFLHEANSIPGRANRWLAHFAEEAFVYFDVAAERLWTEKVRTVGMPVRPQFTPTDPAACRTALGLDPHDPVLLVTGGSQGARAINDLVLRTLTALWLLEPRLQVIHLTGTDDFERAKQAYAARGRRAVVRPFLTEMELALGAATAMVSRAGASSLAETAAMRCPAVLIPYPSAADNHQLFNARAFADTQAARLLKQPEATPEKLLWELRPLLQDTPERRAIVVALARWHYPKAAEAIAAALSNAAGLATGCDLTSLPAAPANPRPPLIGRGAQGAPVQPA